MQSLYSRLVSYWPLHEASGTRYDATGQGNHLTDNATVTQNVGPVTYAADFDDSIPEYLSRVDNASLSTGDIDYSFALWLWMDDKATSHHFVGKWNPTGTENEYILNYDVVGDRFNFFIRNAANTATGDFDNNVFGSPSTSVWYFLYFAHDSVNDLIIQEVNLGGYQESAWSQGGRDSTAEFRLGRSQVAAGFLDGRMAEVGFWKRVLTKQERTWLYNNGLGRTYPFDGRPGSALQTGRNRRNRLTGLIV